MKTAFKIIVYTFAALFALALIAVIFEDEKPPQQDVSKVTQTPAPLLTAPAPPPTPKAASAPESPEKTLGLTELDLVKRINALSRSRDLPPLKQKKPMKCQVSCAATYTQGGLAAYNFTKGKDATELTSVLMIPENNGTGLSAMNAMLVMITMSQALLPESAHKEMADALQSMIKSLESTKNGEATVQGVRFTLADTGFAGLWLTALPE